jgi:hypothetical protein
MAATKRAKSVSVIALGVMTLGFMGLSVTACIAEPEDGEPEDVVPDDGDEDVGETNDELKPRGGALGPTQCGANTCAAGQWCCNASCGTCVSPGGACTNVICDPTY